MRAVRAHSALSCAALLFVAAFARPLSMTLQSTQASSTSAASISTPPSMPTA